MATLSITNNFSLDSNGLIKLGKQGSEDGTFDTAFDITVTGTCHYIGGSLLTATVVTVYDDDSDVPADWDYLYLWSDQICYIQIIGSTTNGILKVAAKQPFVLPGYDVILAAADTTIIAGGTEPPVTDIDSIVIGNYSGNTMSFLFALID